MGKLCIEVTSNDKIAWISEDLCIGCGICVKARPGGALLSAVQARVAAAAVAAASAAAPAARRAACWVLPGALLPPCPAGLAPLPPPGSEAASPLLHALTPYHAPALRYRRSAPLRPS